MGWAFTRSRLLDIAPVARKIAFDNVNNGVLVLDTSDRVVDCNLAATRIFSRSRGALVGLPVAEAWPAGLDLIRGGSRDPTEHQKAIIGNGGDRLTYDVEISPLYGGRENLVGRLVLFQDITERERAEAERRDLEVKVLAQSNLATIGAVATGVAHSDPIRKMPG